MNTLQRCSIIALFILVMTNLALADDKPIVGLIPKAQHLIVIDGKLDEWDNAFVTPLNSLHPNFYNRATHIYYLWDNDAIYIGVRALDTNLSHVAPDTALYDGDAIEFYFDARAGDDLGKSDWAAGTLHAFFTAITEHIIKPRFIVRPLPVFKDLKLTGVELAAVKTPDGYTMEFKLPWSNFPNCTPKAGLLLGIDIEMGSADGGLRVHRTFAYSSPTCVQTPSTQGRVMLVDTMQPAMLKASSRALFPFDTQVTGNYGRIYASACLSPTISKSIAKIDARLLDSAGTEKSKADNTSLSTVANHWTIWRGEWETAELPAGTYTLVLTARDSKNNIVVERTRRILYEP